MRTKEVINIFTTSLLYFISFIDFKSIPIGELLTFFSSVILLIITWKSVSSAKKANITTQKSLEIQEQQFYSSIKPNFIFNIPNSNSINFEEIKPYLGFDKSNKEVNSFSIENPTENIAYNIKVNTYTYMDRDSLVNYWKHYWDFTSLYIPSLYTYKDSYSLKSKDTMEVFIPDHFSRMYKTSNQSYYEKYWVSPPKLFVHLIYKDKLNNSYEEYIEFKTQEVASSGMRIDSYEIKFEPFSVDNETTVKKLNEQRNNLIGNIILDEGEEFGYILYEKLKTLK